MTNQYSKVKGTDGTMTYDFNESTKPSESDCCGSGCNPCILDLQPQLFSKNISDTENIRYDLLSQIQYKPYKIINIDKHTCNSNIYKIQPITDDDVTGILPYKIGQHVIITNAFVNDNDDSENISRPYTPINSTQNCVLEILIKFYENGKMSKFISNLEVNDIIHVRGCFGNFKYEKHYENLVIFCAGTGIAPMYSIVNEILNDEQDETRIEMHFTCHTFADILLRNDLKSFSKFWNFFSWIYLTKEMKENKGQIGENIIYGKIGEQIVKNVIGNKKRALVLICGTISFNEDVQNFVKGSGILEEDIYVF